MGSWHKPVHPCNTLTEVCSEENGFAFLQQHLDSFETGFTWPVALQKMFPFFNASPLIVELVEKPKTSSLSALYDLNHSSCAQNGW